MNLMPNNLQLLTTVILGMNKEQSKTLHNKDAHTRLPLLIVT